MKIKTDNGFYIMKEGNSNEIETVEANEFAIVTKNNTDTIEYLKTINQKLDILLAEK